VAAPAAARWQPQPIGRQSRRLYRRAGALVAGAWAAATAAACLLPGAPNEGPEAAGSPGSARPARLTVCYPLDPAEPASLWLRRSQLVRERVSPLEIEDAGMAGAQPHEALLALFAAGSPPDIRTSPKVARVARRIWRRAPAAAADPHLRRDAGLAWSTPGWRPHGGQFQGTQVAFPTAVAWTWP
jgi:hypothetical protein